MEIRPKRCLTHPMWLAALALLIVNDHLLKGAGLLPGWMTGKLSDFAGMLVAPALLAVLLRLKTRRSFALAHVAVGFVFAAINVAPPVAALVELVSSHTPFPWVITVDPTDLIALPALLVSFRIFARRETAAAGELRMVEAVAILVGGLACAATSEPCDNGDCSGPPAPAPVAEEQASLTIGNTTDKEVLVRVRRLKPEVEANCSVLLDDPTAALSRELFGPAEAWLLQPGRALPLQNGSCTPYLVDAQGMNMTLLAWDEADYPTTVLPTRTDAPSDRMIMMRMTANGRLELDDHPAIHEAPSQEPATSPPHCPLPDETTGIDWSEPVAQSRIVAIESAADGCHRIETETGAMFVCLPMSSLPFVVGEEFGAIAHQSDGVFPETEPEQASTVAVDLYGETVAMRLVRGNVLARKNPLGEYAEQSDYSAHVEDLSGCELQHDSCGSAVVPLGVSLLGAGVSGVVGVEAGQAVTLDGSDTLHLVRAQRMPIVDTACTPSATNSEYYFESVLVWQLEQL